MNLSKLFIIFILPFFSFCNKTQIVSNDALRIAIPSEPSSLDPIIASDLVSKKLNFLIFKTLFVKKGKDSLPYPELVDIILDSKGKMILSVKGIYKSSGIKLSSTDIIYSLQRLMTEKNPRREFYSVIQKLKQIDSEKLEINYNTTRASLLELLSHSSASIYSAEIHQNKKEFVSYGDYELISWVRNEKLVLKKKSENPNLPNQIELIYMANNFTGIYLFSKGKIDIIKIPYYLINHPAVKNARLESQKGKSVQYASIYWGESCFDKNFRMAVNGSIDRDKIISKIFEGYGDSTYLPFTNEYTFKENKLDKYKFNFNLDLAKKYLQKSKCYPQILTREIDFRMRADEENKAKGATILQYLKDLGLNVKLNALEKPVLYKDNGERKGDITLLTWYLDYDSSLNFIDPLFAKDSFGNGGNRTFYENEKLEQILSQARVIGELTKEMQNQTMEILKEDLPWIFLWTIHETYLVSKKAEQYSERTLFFF